MFEIIRPGTRIDFLGKWKIAAAVSLGVLLLGAIGVPVLGFRLGVDFAGGSEVQVRFTGEGRVGEGAIRNVLGDVGIENASVVRVGQGNEFLLKFQGERQIAGGEDAEAAPAAAPSGSVEAPGAPVEAAGAATQAASGAATQAAADAAGAGSSAAPAEPPAAGGGAAPGAPAAATESAPSKGGEITARTDLIIRLEAALAERVGPLEVTRVEFVGPKVGEELRNDGLAALGIACLLILAYIAFRFTPRYAPGAVVALVHDVCVTAAVWVLFGLEFDLRVLAALLAVLGYSLNDTIIVYDRIRENLARHTKVDLVEVLNRSVNETLSRTLLTSFTTLIAVLALLALGGEVVRPFALAMTIGIVVGTYSSIYVASPLLLWLERRRGGGTAAAPRARAAAKA